MGNVLRLQNVEKCVIRSKWCNPLIVKAFSPNESSAATLQAVANVALKHSIGSFFGLIWTIMTK